MMHLRRVAFEPAAAGVVHLQPVPTRPLVELEPTEHPLAVDQREGITPDRAREIVMAVLHPHETRDDCLSGAE